MHIIINGALLVFVMWKQTGVYSISGACWKNSSLNSSHERLAWINKVMAIRMPNPNNCTVFMFHFQPHFVLNYENVEIDRQILQEF